LEFRRTRPRPKLLLLRWCVGVRDLRIRMGSLCGMMIVRQGRRGVGKMGGRSGRGVRARAEEKGGGRDGSGRRVRAEPLRVEARGVVSGGRVRVEESGGSGVEMGGVRADVVGSGIEGDAGRGIGRSGSRGRRL